MAKKKTLLKELKNGFKEMTAYREGKLKLKSQAIDTLNKPPLIDKNNIIFKRWVEGTGLETSFKAVKEALVTCHMNTVQMTNSEWNEIYETILHGLWQLRADEINKQKESS